MEAEGDLNEREWTKEKERGKKEMRVKESEGKSREYKLGGTEKKGEKKVKYTNFRGMEEKRNSKS